MGGELHQCSPVGFQAVRIHTPCKMVLLIARRLKCGACCEACWSGPTYVETLHRMPVEDLCRRFRVSLVCDVYTQAVRRRTSAFLLTHLVGSFASHALRASLMLSFLFMTKRAHIRRKPFSTYVGPHFLLEQHQQRGAAEGATQNRAGIPVHAPHGPGVRRRAVRGGRSLFVRPSSHPLPGPAPGWRPTIRKRDGAVPAEPQEAGRADASRSLYCYGGMPLCRFPSRCFRAGNYKLSGSPPCRQAFFLPAGSFFLCYFPFFSGEEGK